MRKKPFQYTILVATLVATFVFISHCHQRATHQNVQWETNANKRNSIHYSSKKQKRHTNTSSYSDQKRRYSANNKGNFPNDNRKPYPQKQKQLSPQMAYQLLQVLWGKSKENRQLLLQKTQKDSAQLQEELAKHYQQGTRFISNFNPNDSICWFTLPGFARKEWYNVRKYRDKLGGFYSSDQLAEIPNLDSIFLRIALNHVNYHQNIQPYRKISAQSTWKELYQHPYIGPTYAKIIYAYYQQHPNPSFSNLQQIQGIKTQHLQRLIPYLSNNRKD